MSKIDVGAYIWPAFTGKEKRAWQFWNKKIGEWQTVKTATHKLEGDCWPRKPLWGYQDEADSKVMEFQIEEATKYGVNVFIYDWYWYDGKPFLENCLKDGFLKARNNDKMKFYLMWANHNATSMWDKRLADPNNLVDIWNGRVDFKEFKIIVEHIIKNFFLKPNYYIIDGKPIMSIYDMSNLIIGLGGIKKTVKAIKYFNDRCVFFGFKGLHLQMILMDVKYINISGVDDGKKLVETDVIKLLNIDSVTHYQYVHFTDVTKGYDKVLQDVKNEYHRVENSYDVPYFPHVSVGWNNNPRTKKTINYLFKDNSPNNFERAVTLAKEYAIVHNSPLITVNSWNEWTETSYLEPDDINGYGYLEAIKKVME